MDITGLIFLKITFSDKNKTTCWIFVDKLNPQTTKDHRRNERLQFPPSIILMNIREVSLEINSIRYGKRVEIELILQFLLHKMVHVSFEMVKQHSAIKKRWCRHLWAPLNPQKMIPSHSYYSRKQRAVTRKFFSSTNLSISVASTSEVADFELYSQQHCSEPFKTGYYLLWDNKFYEINHLRLRFAPGHV